MGSIPWSGKIPICRGATKHASLEPVVRNKKSPQRTCVPQRRVVPCSPLAELGETCAATKPTTVNNDNNNNLKRIHLPMQETGPIPGSRKIPIYRRATKPGAATTGRSPSRALKPVLPNKRSHRHQPALQRRVAPASRN